MKNHLKKLGGVMVAFLCALGRLLKSTLSNVLVRHFACLLSQWDPVQSLGVAGSRRSVGSNFSNLFAIFSLLVTAVYGIVGLHFEATESLDWNQLPSSPTIFTHQVRLCSSEIAPKLFTHSPFFAIFTLLSRRSFPRLSGSKQM